MSIGVDEITACPHNRVGQIDGGAYACHDCGEPMPFEQAVTIALKQILVASNIEPKD